MVRNIGNEGRDIYHISCSDWECVVESEDATDAVAQGLSDAFEEYGDDLNLSRTISIVNCSNFHFQETEKVEFETYSVPQILFDIGKFSLGEKLQEILQNER